MKAFSSTVAVIDGKISKNSTTGIYEIDVAFAEILSPLESQHIKEGRVVVLSTDDKAAQELFHRITMKRKFQFILSFDDE